MAVNIGPKIGLEGEQEYRKAIQNIIQQQKTLNSELAKTTSAFDKDTSAVQKAKTQREYLTKQIQLQEQRVLALTEQMQKCRDVEGESSDKTLKWQQAVNEATQKLNELNNELKNTPSNIQVLGSQLEASGEKISNVGTSISDVGKKMSIASAAVAGIATAGIKVAADFEESMSKVKAVSGATGDEFEDLRQLAIDLGADTVYSASEVADAMTDMAKAGWNSQQIMDGMNGVLAAAAASGEDLASVSTIVADAITGFGMAAEDATHVADVLSYTANAGTIDINDLGESFKYIAPYAQAAGYDIEEVSTAILAMSKNGIKGSQAGTTMRATLTALVNPTDKTKEAMEALGVQIADENGNMVSFSNLVDQLRTGFSGLTQEQQNYYANVLAGDRGGAGVLALVQATSDEYAEMEANIRNCDGTAQATAETMQDNLNMQVEQLTGALESLAIEMSEAVIPWLTELAQKATEVVDWFTQLDDGTQNMILTIGGIVLVAGPLVTMLGSVVTGIGNVVSFGGKLLQGSQSLIEKLPFISSGGKDAASGVSELGDAASSASGATSSASTSFGELAGQALKIVAVGASLALAGVGLKAIAEGAATLSTTGLSGALALGELTLAGVGLAAALTALAPASTAGAVGLLALSAASLGIGAAIWLIADAAVKLSPELSNIATYGGSAALALGELALGSTALGASLVVLAAGSASAAVGIGALDLAMAAAVLTFGGAALALGDFPSKIGTLSTNASTASTNMNMLNSKVTSYNANSKLAKTNTDGLNSAMSNLGTKTNDGNNKLETMKNKLNNVKSAETNVTNQTNTMKNSVGQLSTTLTTSSTKLADMSTKMGTVTTKMSSLRSAVTSMTSSFTTLSQSFASTLANMNTAAQSQLNNLASRFRNTKLSLNQNIALPHFSMSGSFNAKTKSVPRVNVSWYKKAYDNAIMFNSPTVLPTANGFKGFGDGNGAEIVIGQNKLLDTIQTAVSNVGGGTTINVTVNGADGMDVRELADEVMDRINYAVKRKKGAFAI